jgi:hypothetical protein
MKLSKFTLAISLVVVSTTTLAATAVAPINRIRIWDGPYALPDSQYSIGTTTAMGAIKTLKSNATVISMLTTTNYATNTGGLDMTRDPGAKLSAEPFNGSAHQRLSDVGTVNWNGTERTSGQCVAFARSMTGSAKTKNWYPGKKIADYLSWNGAGYLLNALAVPALQPGTMIAHFQSKSPYPSSKPYGHVAIFLSWSKNAQGYIDGINVVDENLIELISGNTGDAGGLIQKHKLPLLCTAGASCGNLTHDKRFFSMNYHVVDVQ